MRRKRIFALLMSLMLVVALVPLRQAAKADEAEVRVKLSIGTTTQLSVSVIGRYTVNGKEISGGTLTATVSGSSVVVSHSVMGTLDTDATVRVRRQSAAEKDAYLTLKNSRYGTTNYLGDLVFSVSGGYLTAINYVSMSPYLYGVLGGELSDGNAYEALKAQCIAAKGYALAEINSSAAYDVVDSSSDQVYKGYNPANTRIIAAVGEVGGQTLCYNGAPVKCFYTSANGGQSLTPFQWWGGHSYDGIYQMRYDPFDAIGDSNASALSITCDPATLPTALYNALLALANTAAGTALSEIVSIDALTGYYSKSDSVGTERCPIERAPQESAEARLTVKSAAGESKSVNVTFSLSALRDAGAINASSDANIYFITQLSDGTWRIVFGKSSGHRVGISHRGLKAMADLGNDYLQILSFYYPGAAVIDENGNPLAADAVIYPDAQAELTISGYGYVNDANVNFRSGPSTSYSVLYVLEQNAKLTLYGKVGNWYRALDQGTGVYGYIYDQYVSETAAALPTPTATPTVTVKPSTPTPALPVFWDGPGDVDGDNCISAADAAKLLRHVVELDRIDDALLPRADADRDGYVLASDAAFILRCVVGLSSPLDW